MRVNHNLFTNFNNNNSNIVNNQSNNNISSQAQQTLSHLSNNPSSNPVSLRNVHVLDSIKAESVNNKAPSSLQKWEEMVKSCSSEARKELPSLIFAGLLSEKEVSEAISQIKLDFEKLDPSCLKAQEQMGDKLNFLHALHVAMKIWQKHNYLKEHQTACLEEYNQFFAPTVNVQARSQLSIAVSILREGKRELEELIYSIDDCAKTTPENTQKKIIELQSKIKESYAKIEKFYADSKIRAPASLPNALPDWCIKFGKSFHQILPYDPTLLKGYLVNHVLLPLEATLNAIETYQINYLFKLNYSKEAFEDILDGYDLNGLNSAQNQLCENSLKPYRYKGSPLAQGNPSYSIIQALCCYPESETRLKMTMEKGVDTHWVPSRAFPLFPILMLYNSYIEAIFKESDNSNYKDKPTFIPLGLKTSFEIFTYSPNPFGDSSEIKRRITLLEQRGIHLDLTDPSVELAFKFLPEFESIFKLGYKEKSIPTLINFIEFLEIKNVLDPNDVIFRLFDQNKEKLIKGPSNKLSFVTEYISPQTDSSFYFVDFQTRASFLIFGQILTPKEIEGFIKEITDTISLWENVELKEESKKNDDKSRWCLTRCKEALNYIQNNCRIRDEILNENNIEINKQYNLNEVLPKEIVSIIGNYSPISRMSVYLQCEKKYRSEKKLETNRASLGVTSLAWAMLTD